MNFFIVSIFPEIFNSFLNCSLIEKWIEAWKIQVNVINPRDFVYDKQKKIDDEIYWWWSWLLIKAKPIIDSVESVLDNISWTYKILFLSPSENIFNQSNAIKYSKIKNLIIVNWRYEWIDFRFERYFNDKYNWSFEVVSVWKFVLMWWEVASMCIIESIARLVPWVISDENSHLEESYSVSKDMNNIEYPQYTRPYNVYWYEVPDILLSWNHSRISNRRKKNERYIK